MPVVSRLYRKQLILKFTQNLGILLGSNVDIIKSFEIVKKVVGNIIIERKIDEASQKIKEGTPVSKALSKGHRMGKCLVRRRPDRFKAAPCALVVSLGLIALAGIQSSGVSGHSPESCRDD